MKIKGGYYIKARCIQNSEIAIMPPYIREIWDWLLKEANHSDVKSNGSTIKRGQLIRTFKDIQEGLKWMIGYRKMTYKKWQCENSMRFLRKRGMVTTMKTTRGMLITICNYLLYQDPTNYESNTRAVTRTTVNKQLTDTINKNVKNVKNDKKEEEKKISFSFKDKKFLNLTLTKMELYEEKYPVIDVYLEIEKMEKWLLSEKVKKDEGKKSKIPKDYNRFIHNWFKKASEDK